MPLWVELVVSLLIVYGAVVTIAVPALERRRRLIRIGWMRLARRNRTLPEGD